MALEDLAMMRAVPGCVVLYPCDAVSTSALVAAAAAHDGMTYIRTSRPKTPVVYAADERFPIGGSKILRQSAADAATVVAAGVTVFEALAACETLAETGVRIRVIDAYSLQPIDAAALVAAARETGDRLITVEDHYAAGGAGRCGERRRRSPRHRRSTPRGARRAQERQAVRAARPVRHLFPAHRGRGQGRGRGRSDVSGLTFSPGEVRLGWLHDLTIPFDLCRGLAATEALLEACDEIPRKSPPRTGEYDNGLPTESKRVDPNGSRQPSPSVQVTAGRLPVRGLRTAGPAAVSSVRRATR